MARKTNIFANKYVTVTVRDESSGVGSYLGLYIRFRGGKDDAFTLELNGDGLGVLVKNGDELECDEKMLVNVIANTLFELTPQKLNFGKYNAWVELPKGMPEWLLTTGKEYIQEDYAGTDTILYNLGIVKQVYLHRLEGFMDTVESQEAIDANKAIIRIVENTEGKGRAAFIDCDFHFQDDRYTNKFIEEKGFPFNHVVPMYTCDRKQIAGLMKHALNYLKKVERESPRGRHRQMAADLRMQDYFDEVKWSEDGCFARIGKGEYKLLAMDTGRVNLQFRTKSGELFNATMPYNLEMVQSIVEANERGEVVDAT